MNRARQKRGYLRYWDLKGSFQGVIFRPFVSIPWWVVERWKYGPALETSDVFLVMRTLGSAKKKAHGSRY